MKKKLSLPKQFDTMKITKLFPILAAGILALFTVSSCSSSPLYGFKAVSNQGEEVDFSSYKGKVLLIVNTASKCGFTPQYEGLEALYQQFKDKGLVVIGFPCDQFGHQEPGSNDEIAEFCKLNYGVTFPLMDKTEVNGEIASLPERTSIWQTFPVRGWVLIVCMSDLS